MLWLKLLKSHRTSLQDRLRFTVRYCSQWLVFRPNCYCVVGLIEDSLHGALLARLVWFYEGLEGASFHLRRPDGWHRYVMTAGRLDDQGRSRPLAALLAALSGKILVHDYGVRWQKADHLLCYKVFIINWTREYRVSSWRFCASMAARPFQRLAEVFDRPDKRVRRKDVVIVGNGPSAGRIFDAEFADMDVIVCNTAIKSQRLLAERHLVSLCFIDATFFIGPSNYTRAFFAALNEAVSVSDFSVYVDFQHEALIRQRVPQLHPDRIFPLYLEASIEIQASFKAGLAQSTSGSVSTSVLFPLGATYYSRIYLLGFDGKDPGLTNYFWKHSDEFQFNDLLPTVQASDPGFFAGRDYVWQSQENDRQTEAFLQVIERGGTRVVMTHPSFIEPLKRRYQTPLPPIG